MEITERAAVRSMDIFVRAVCALREKKYYGEFRVNEADFKLVAGNNVYKAVFESKDPPDKIISDFSAQCAEFHRRRLQYLLY
ncbi:MAG TPA: hypothetical protein DCS63_03985 [Elusimicrobia bacterium]|nr:hypothetical protein [Elusimicrobiota bacterium]